MLSEVLLSGTGFDVTPYVIILSLFPSTWQQNLTHLTHISCCAKVLHPSRDTRSTMVWNSVALLVAGSCCHTCGITGRQ